MSCLARSDLLLNINCPNDLKRLTPFQAFAGRRQHSQGACARMTKSFHDHCCFIKNKNSRLALGTSRGVITTKGYIYMYQI